MSSYKVTRLVQSFYHPVVTPLLIGFHLPSFIGENKLIEFPVLIAAPVFYTAYSIGDGMYKHWKEIENEEKKKNNRKWF